VLNHARQFDIGGFDACARFAEQFAGRWGGRRGSGD
jgi:hypothetical protein